MIVDKAFTSFQAKLRIWKRKLSIGRNWKGNQGKGLRQYALWSSLYVTQGFHCNISHLNLHVTLHMFLVSSFHLSLQVLCLCTLHMPIKMSVFCNLHICLDILFPWFIHTPSMANLHLEHPVVVCTADFPLDRVQQCSARTRAMVIMALNLNT